jgi:NitT/TauT family transport system ATP-binding protein
VSSGAGEVLLKVHKVKLTLGGALILDDVSFDVIDRVREGATTGQIVALLGPSGVGKTRLLRIIAGLDAPDAGNLELAGTIGGLDTDSARQRTKELLKTFGLSNRGGFYPAQLSGGQRQRAAIAQQLVVPRRLLLMDEPFSGLDPAALEDVMKLLIEVANLDELNTILVVTHDIRAAMAVSDTVYMLGCDRKDDKAVPGARIQATYDLVALDLAWKADIQTLPAFVSLEREIKAKFRTL